MFGPLTKHELAINCDKHQIPEDELGVVTARYKKPYAWLLSDVKRLERPVPYKHSGAAVVWLRVGGE